MKRDGTSGGASDGVEQRLVDAPVDQRAKHQPIHAVLADGARLVDQPSADVRVGDLVRLGTRAP